jgi:hypothetical protein
MELHRGGGGLGQRLEAGVGRGWAIQMILMAARKEIRMVGLVWAQWARVRWEQELWELLRSDIKEVMAQWAREVPVGAEEVVHHHQCTAGDEVDMARKEADTHQEEASMAAVAYEAVPWATLVPAEEVR